MGNKYEERYQYLRLGHFRHTTENLIDLEKTLEEIGLKSGMTLLDAGCGEGSFSIPASKIVGSNGKVYAIDISEEAINILKEKIKEKGIRNIEAFTGDITKKLSLEDESIDICLMVNILHGLVAGKKVKNTLKEMFRVLRPNGILAIVDFKKIKGPPGPPLSLRMSPEEVEEIIGKYGFKKKKFVEAGRYHYAITFVKKNK